MNLIIYLPSYNEKIGGVIALHKLLHILISEFSQFKVFAFPYFDYCEYSTLGVLNENPFEIEKYNMTIKNLDNYHINPEFKYSFIDIRDHNNLRIIANDDKTVVIYPEVIAGNPLGIKNVVRWLLHDPGRITGKVYYHTGELYFPYVHFTEKIKIPQSKMSETVVHVLHTPIDLFLGNEKNINRSGSAYCMRKGKGREIVHDIENSICIDDLPQNEIAEIFKSIEIFYAYDTRTYYSQLAALAGCKSVIIPHPTLDHFEDTSFLLGVAYGLDDLERAEKTKHLLIEDIKNREDEAKLSINLMITEIIEYFKL